MNYLKSALVGLAAVVVVFVVFPILVATVSIFVFAAKHGFAGIGINALSLRLHAPPVAYVLFVLLVFGLAFLWELRRLTK
jgi:hypothetical protein